MKLLDMIRDAVRHVMREIARSLNALTGGKLSPNTVTIVGLLAHLPIAWLIFKGYFVLAGVWLIVFGLFDTLDGELARLQKRDSPAGMFLDSVTDRMKEIILYIGISAQVMSVINASACGRILGFCYDNLAGTSFGTNYMILFLIVLLGGSLLTSYINAWGEAVLSRAGASKTAINKTFRGGLASFEIRIALIAFGLLTGLLFTALLIIAMLVGFTIVSRMYRVFRELSRVQS